MQIPGRLSPGSLLSVCMCVRVCACASPLHPLQHYIPSAHSCAMSLCSSCQRRMSLASWTLYEMFVCVIERERERVEERKILWDLLFSVIPLSQPSAVDLRNLCEDFWWPLVMFECVRACVCLHAGISVCAFNLWFQISIQSCVFGVYWPGTINALFLCGITAERKCCSF